MTRFKKIAGRALATLGVAGLAVAGAAGAAFADDADIGNIDPNEPSSLTIHKYDGNATVAGDGTDLGQAAPDLPKLDGVEFTIVPVVACGGENIDLATPEGWDKAVEIYTAQVPSTLEILKSQCTTGAPTVVTTDGGVASASLPQGLYYVFESNPGPNIIVAKVVPFYVAIPMPTEKPDGNFYWNYNVHVYPKNSTEPGDVEKEIDEARDALAIGDEVRWTITAKIPNTVDDIWEASIYDQLDTSLKYLSSTVKVDDSLVASNEITEPAANATGAIVWTFTDPAGLELINENKGKNITIEFVTEVTKAIPNGTVENEPGEPGNGYGSSFNEKPTEGKTTPGKSDGLLSILKIDGSNSEKVLEGAEFAVYLKGEAECGTTPPSGTPVATGVSNDKGVVQWNDNKADPLHLWVDTSQDIKTDPLETTRQYCVYETKAPAGYTAGTIDNPVTITSGAENIKEFSVKNIQKKGPELPLTGSNGTALMIVGGLGLIALAGGAHMVSRRRQA